MGETECARVCALLQSPLARSLPQLLLPVCVCVRKRECKPANCNRTVRNPGRLLWTEQPYHGAVFISNLWKPRTAGAGTRKTVGGQCVIFHCAFHLQKNTSCLACPTTFTAFVLIWVIFNLKIKVNTVTVGSTGATEMH